MKKLSFYLTESVLDIYCDHMPLRKFLTGTTRCDKVNNWAIELQSFRAKINFIQGKKNTLADTMSRLVKLGIAEIDEQEPEGFEFGYQLFGEVDEINEITVPSPINVPPPGSTDKTNSPDSAPVLTISPEAFSSTKMSELQAKDKACQGIKRALLTKRGSKSFFIQQDVLYRTVHDRGKEFHAVVLPKVLYPHILHVYHEQMGHNGARRQINLIRRHYYWRKMG